MLDYLRRYPHRVVMANHSLLLMTAKEVTSKYKDRRRGSRTRLMTVAVGEFVHRFLMHVLPPRCVKIRYFGFMFHREKRTSIALIGEQMRVAQANGESAFSEDVSQIMVRQTGIDICRRPHCGNGQIIQTFKIPRSNPVRGLPWFRKSNPCQVPLAPPMRCVFPMKNESRMAESGDLTRQ